MAKLTFLGAAGCVTGSKYLVEAAGKRLLVDCGIFQGSPELQDRNYKQLPVDPNSIDYLVLTHAHLDHTGWLPVLVKSGYRGPIFANPATIELTTILLKDSAHLQEEDTLHARIHKDSRHADPQPLYTSEDVDPTLRLIEPGADHYRGRQENRCGFLRRRRALQPADSEGSNHPAIESGCADLRIYLWRPRASRWGRGRTSGANRQPHCEARRLDCDSILRYRAHTDLHVLFAAARRPAAHSAPSGVRGQPHGAERHGFVRQA